MFKALQLSYEGRVGISLMVHIFDLPENRLTLLRRLECMSFKVRMHGYEYFVRKDLFVFVLILLPAQRRAVFYKVAWNLHESLKAIEVAVDVIEEFDAGLAVEVI